MNLVEQDFDIRFSRAKLPVPIEAVREQATAGDAIGLACDASDLALKQIQDKVVIDQGYFSKLISNKATLQADKIALFCHVVGNTVYPQWIAHQVGCVLVDNQRYEELLAVEAREKELQLKVAVLMGLLNQKLGAVA